MCLYKYCIRFKKWKEKKTKIISVRKIDLNRQDIESLGKWCVLNEYSVLMNFKR